MDQPSKQIADRYRLQLSDVWRQWFDTDAADLRPAGMFRISLSAAQLTAEQPTEIWPGFMLPDTLPIIGNEYGDWLCVRAMPDDRLGELVHWYHGGGDWIPIGNRLAEALLHDTVDQFRPIGGQMLRGAAETVAPNHCDEVLSRTVEDSFLNWLCEGLASEICGVSGVATRLGSLVEHLRNNHHQAALRLLYENAWSIDAVACDLIEDALQRPVSKLADPKIAELLEVDWSPDFVRWLFDLGTMPEEHRRRVVEQLSIETSAWPNQDWMTAEEIAGGVLRRRSDVGWAYDIAGWCRQRAGDPAVAAKIYWSGRMASSFSDQAVRMRTHWFDQRHGKFSIAQLLSLTDHITSADQQDPYLSAVRQPTEKRLRSVREYWQALGRQKMRQDAHAEAYACFYRAGWDMGAHRLSEYRPILESLIECAHAAGWSARAAIAETHLACLQQR